MIFLKLLGKLIKALKSAESPRQMAWGFALGAFLGFMPFNTLFTVSTFLVIFLFRINFASAMLAFGLYSVFAYVLDPLFHQLGFFILVQLSFLKPIWTALYNFPISPLTRFNNSVVIGSLIFSILVFIPNYIFFQWFVTRYRETWNEKINKWKIVQVLKGSKLVKFYTKIKAMGG
ncbi:TIGR03546 family protein [bacterium]